MKLEFHGVRGSFPAPEPDRARFGGHTTCASLRTGEDRYIVIDAGTGLRGLGERIIRGSGNGEIRVDLLLTHFHLDHIIGFPFFAPLFSPRTVLVVHAAGDPGETRQALAGLMAGRYFPISLGKTAARTEFREFAPGAIDGVRVSSCPLRHPQGSVAYRLEADGWSLVHATDTEHPATGVDRRLAASGRGGRLACLRRHVYAGGIRSREKGLGPFDLAGRRRIGRLGPGQDPRSVPLRSGPYGRRYRAYPQRGP